MATKWVYMFKEGDATMRNLLGGKGANLAEMTNLGLPVPQGFTITTEACTQYYEDGRKINDEIMGQIMEAIDKMEGITGKKFGDKENPLLVSVRSGARASMPGMMDTILNLGLNEEVVETLAQASGNPRWAWDCYRRFIQMFSDVVMEVGKKYFEELIDKMKEEKGVKQDVDLNADDLKKLAEQFKAEYKEKIGKDFPTDPKEQLMEAIKAVFRSWDNPRANVYRRDNDIPYSWGTAVNVMPMVFGNLNDQSGCYRFAEIDQKKFGSITDVTDKGYYTNSYHVDVREKIDAFDKFTFESQFQTISTGGCISYVEIPNLNKNLEAVAEVVKFIYDNIQYAEFNTKSDYCQECGYDGEIMINDEFEWECPVCHNKDQAKMNVTRRTCGYLGENFWNPGKTKEIKSRVMHL